MGAFAGAALGLANQSLVGGLICGAIGTVGGAAFRGPSPRP